MELFPTLRLGWLNGWLLAAPFYLGYALLLRLFPREVVDRLYDRTGWTRRQRILSAIGLPFALAGVVLLILTPLKIGHPVFGLGLTMYGLGFLGFVIALMDFRYAPLDRPATAGSYRFSRNPQWVSFALTLVGVGAAVGSGIICLLFGVRIFFNHFRILGEERALLAQYGDAYRAYLNQVPRYLLFF